MPELNVLVLAGGISHEREVSLRSGRRVADALEAAGFRVHVADPDGEFLTRVQQERPDVVFPALHGVSGEDGTLLGLLEALNIPFVGSSSSAAMLAWSKPIARHLVAQAGLSIPRGVVLSRDAFRELSAPAVLAVLGDTFTIPVVVKPGSGGSAQGVTIVRTPEAFARALVDAFAYSDTALCEHYVAGVEVAVAVLDTGEGPRALPAVEIDPIHGDYDYEARYNAGETRFFTPARLDPQVAERVAFEAVRAHEALGLRDVSRIDFIVDTSGTPWFLEANAIPGMTETSLLPLALDAAGLSASDAYGALVRLATLR